MIKNSKDDAIDLATLSRRDSAKLDRLIGEGINITDQSREDSNIYIDSEAHSRVEAKSRRSNNFIQTGNKIFKNLSRMFGPHKSAARSYGMGASEAAGNPSLSEN